MGVVEMGALVNDRPSSALAGLEASWLIVGDILLACLTRYEAVW